MGPHSPDLSPPDFMLRGHFKSKVYETNPSTIQQLKAPISEEMRRVSVDMVDRTIRHVQEVRLPLILEHRGAHLKHL